MQQETPAASEPRESLWSVPPGFWVLYFILFALLDAAGVGYAVWHEIRYGAGENIHAHINAVIPRPRPSASAPPSPASPSRRPCASP